MKTIVGIWKADPCKMPQGYEFGTWGEALDFYKRNRKDFTIWYHFFDAGRSSVLRRYSMELIDKNATERALTVAAASGKDKDRRTWAKAICVLHDMPVVSPVAV